jgi:hypothetical protein
MLSKCFANMQYKYKLGCFIFKTQLLNGLNYLAYLKLAWAWQICAFR